MQAKQADGARSSVRDILQYLITIPEVKDAIKKMVQKLNSGSRLVGGGRVKDWHSNGSVQHSVWKNKATYEYQSH